MKYTIKEAIKEIKAKSKEKFSASVEAHINLDLDKSQTVRYTTTLPHGTGKTKRIAVFASGNVEGADLHLSESDILRIEKGELVAGKDFDVLITEPKFMPKIAKVAGILGPVGAMPNPKSGTVTDNIEVAVKNFKLGQMEIRTEASAPIIHTIIGKVDWENEKLEENLAKLVTTLRQNKPAKAKPTFLKSVFIKTTMGKAIEIEC
jgi:large subunit ribosomal protein L1